MTRLPPRRLLVLALAAAASTAAASAFAQSADPFAVPGTPAAAPAIVPAPTTRPGLLQRLRGKLRRTAPAPGTPVKPGLLARFRRKPATNLPARRGPSWLDRGLRAISRIPAHISKLWRLALRPFGRASGLRSKLAAPFMSLKMVFSRFTRMLSRWTGGAGE